MAMFKEAIHVLRLPRLPTLKMLHIEEILLRHDPLKRNFLLTNHPLPEDDAVVLGISGKPEKLVHIPNTNQDGVPMIKRYTGGGTVYVNDNVRFVSFIMNKASLPNVQPYPHDIMKWTERVYRTVFQGVEQKYWEPEDIWGMGNDQTIFGENTPNAGPFPFNDDKEFSLMENDYCFGQLKFGGNAQSIIRDRWVHHTSFLWNLDSEAITKYLTLPDKRPAYREDRPHSDFLCPLHPAFPPLLGNETVQDNAYDTRFEDSVIEQLDQWFTVVPVSLEDQQINELITSVDHSSLGSKILNLEHVSPQHLRYR